MKRKFLLLGVLASAMCLLMVGCGNEEKVSDGNLTEIYSNTTPNVKQEKVDGDNDKNVENALQELEKLANATKQDNIDAYELYSNDKRIVFKYNDTTYYVFTYNEDKITGYAIYADYANNSLAKEALNVHNDELDEKIEKIYVDGQYLVSEYKESEYIGLSVSELHEVMASLQEVKKEN